MNPVEVVMPDGREFRVVFNDAYQVIYFQRVYTRRAADGQFVTVRRHVRYRQDVIDAARAKLTGKA